MTSTTMVATGSNSAIENITLMVSSQSGVAVKVSSAVPVRIHAAPRPQKPTTDMRVALNWRSPTRRGAMK